MLGQTSYVKLTGTIEDRRLKLFILEKDVLRVLNKLTKEQGEKPDGYLVVTMRKVYIDKQYKKRLEPIVLKSLAAVGIAA